MSRHSAGSDFWAGIRDTLPMLIGAAPFGLIFGTLAGPAGLTPLATLAMSLLVFGGASQFIAISLLAAGTGAWVIIATTFIVNLRHALYGAALRQQVLAWPRAQRALAAFFLTDETFAIVINTLGKGGPVHLRHYYFGSALSMYGNWLAWTLVGLLLGDAVPQLAHWGLEFAMVATFIGIVVPLLRGRADLLAALVAGVVALLAHGLPYKLGLMVAACAGIAAGLAMERYGRTPS
ncbi:AzlC family ABC transporter permease [Chitiniphilus purpureus]|uniref:AzlC family ABC transporter permease n=1 Tax=Chitiniphilus purpureus TaxID=2981137 RepID=A0ABY6DKY2_9NEIS|nr:AzlC family ABC transporter permease [Chitiniphilus sp. CD1]UXY15015.1 AzlC family ABC transporter permease [Chitiniphilus sp. CD1]